MFNEWPRRYTVTELEAIARSIGRTKLTMLVIDKLQEAVEAYQWGCLVDDRIFPSSSNKGRRKSLKHIIALCEQEAKAEEIEKALSKLDALAFQLLGAVNPMDWRNIRGAAERALQMIPKRGPDPKRARRQFIANLICIYSLATGKRAGRRVHDRDYGPFLDFVKAALEPFKAQQGCEADIKFALRLKRA